MMSTQDIGKLIDSADQKKSKRTRENIIGVVVLVLALGAILRCVETLLNIPNDFAFSFGLFTGAAALVYYPLLLIKFLRRK